MASIFVTNGTQSNTLGTIPDALAYANTIGGEVTMTLSAGSHPEAVDLTVLTPSVTSLTIDGTGTIDPAQGDLLTTTTPVSGLTVSTVVKAEGVSNVTIEGVTIDGGGHNPATPIYSAVAVTDAVGTASTGITIDGVTITGMSGHPQGRGIYAGSDETDADVTITNADISDFFKAGIVLDGVLAEVSDNTITGAGAVSNVAQNGIEGFELRDGSTVQGNTVEAIGYTGAQPDPDNPTVAASGIVILGGSGVLVGTLNNAAGAADGNSIFAASEPTAAFVGIVAAGGSDYGGPADGIEIGNNNVNGPGTGGVSIGVDTSGLQGGVIQSNTVSNAAIGYTVLENLDVTSNPQFGPDVDGGDPLSLSNNVNDVEIGVDFEGVPSPAATNVNDDNVFGTGGNDNLDGGNGDDTLRGDAGDDAMFGGVGVDELRGGLGDDSLNGQSGGDLMVGARGDDSYFVNSRFDDVRENAGDTFGSDIVYVLAYFENEDAGEDPGLYLYDNVEDMTYLDEGTDPFSLFGNDLDNLINITAAAVAGTVGGGIGDDSVAGSAFADSIDGGAGNDVLFGGDGDGVNPDNDGDIDDTGNDTILGGAGDDAIFGEGGDDSLVGGDDDDDLDGGLGADTMEGGAGDDTYQVDNAGDVVTELAGEGDDGVGFSLSTYAVPVNVEDATYVGVAGQNVTLTGNDEDNRLDVSIVAEGFTTDVNGGAGADLIIGGEANDTLRAGNETAPLGGINRLVGGDGDDSLVASVGANQVGDSLAGQGGNDTLRGNREDNLLLGNDGDDSLTGGAGIDTMVGGTGNDIFALDRQDDIVSENAGEGVDTAEFNFADFNLSQVLDPDGQPAQIENATYVVEGGTVDSLVGNDLDNVLDVTVAASAGLVDGADGADTILGSGGVDSLLGDDGDDEIDGGAGADTIRGGAGEDTLSAGESTDASAGSNVFGNDGNDVLYASTGAEAQDSLRGMVGDDSLTANDAGNLLAGAIGDDTLVGGAGVDTLAGAQGNDVYVIGDDTDDVIEELNGIDTVQYTRTGTFDLGDFSGIENADFVGASGTTSLLGTTDANLLSGDDGDDTIRGDAGADTMEGGLGNDTYQVDDAGDEITDTGGDDDLVEYTTAQLNLRTFDGVDNAFFIGTGNSTLRGNDDANDLAIIRANRGEIFGGGGDDTLDGSGSGDDVLRGQAGEDLLRGRGGDDELLGAAGDDELRGAAGDDTLTGGTGADEMLGGTGNDTYQVDDAGDRVRENAGSGTDTVEFTINNLDLTSFLDGGTSVSEIENAVYTGAPTDDITLVGNDFANDLDVTALSSLAGAQVDGGGGADLIRGGSGNDLLSAGVETADLGGAENEIFGGDGDDTLEASQGAFQSGDSLRGQGGDDVLNGNSEVNALFGGAGNDTLAGGGGIDDMRGGADDDLYKVDTQDDRITEANSTAGGIDTVETALGVFSLADLRNFNDNPTFVENATYTGGGSVAQFAGNQLDNVLDVSGANGANVFGAAGDDTIVGSAEADFIDGETGADEMSGGAGNDEYFVDDGGDQVIEAPGEGTDAVRVFTDTAVDGTYELTDNVEAGTFVGTAQAGQVDLLGNDGDNSLSSSFVFEGVTLSGGANVEIDGAGGTDIITGYTAAEILRGGAGSDAIEGGDGNDTIDGGTGADLLYGGVLGGTPSTDGDDVFLYDEVDDSPIAGGIDPFADADEIADFFGAGVAGGDQVDLSALGVSVFQGTGSLQVGVADANFLTDGFDGFIGVDVQGAGGPGTTPDGVEDMVIILTGVTSMISDDFILT